MMGGAQVFVFGSFSEDEASLFQKTSREGGIKPVMLNDLQFGSLNNQVKVSLRTSEVTFKQGSNGEEVNRVDLKEKSKAPPNGNGSIPNGGKPNKSALKVLNQVSNGIQDESVAFNSAKSQVSVIESHCSPPVNNSESFHFPDSEKVTSVNNTDNAHANLDLCGNNAIAENGEKKMTEKNQCMQEQKWETNSNLTGTSFGTLQQLGSSGLKNSDALDGDEEAFSVFPSNLPKSWAARFGGKVGNNVQALYSHGGDTGRSKPAAAAASTRASPGKVNGNSSAILTSNDRVQKMLGEEEVTGKRLQPRGLVNTGNLCFLNATLQALLSCTPFLQLLQGLRSRDISEAGYPTLKAFVEFVAEFDEDRPDDVTPKKNDKAIGVLEAGKAFCPSMFDPVLKSFSPDQPLSASGRARQEDAQEFLSFVMDRMHDELLKLEGSHLTSAGGKLPMITISEEDDFLESVSTMSRLRHPNITELVGYCTEHGQRLLVYEYFGNGTLHDILHFSDDSSKKLSWNARVRIALGTARALEYLHEVCLPSVVHRNFKSANILLDDEINPHLFDCGIACLNPSPERQVSTQMLGSFGYSAPEYAMSGIYTVKRAFDRSEAT